MQISRKVAAIVTAITVVAGATACGSTGTPAGAPEPAQPSGSAPAVAGTSTTADAPAGPTTPQGWLIKQLGETAGVGCVAGLESCRVKFAVDRIDVNPECAEFGTPAKAGNKVLLLTVSMTTADIDGELAGVASVVFNPYSMKGVTPDGFVHDAESPFCVDAATSFPSTISPNSRYTGTVQLELPAGVTTVAAVPNSFESSTGWAWPTG